MARDLKSKGTEGASDIEAPSKPTFTREEYNDVAGAAELAQIMLVSSNFEVKPEFWKAKKEDSDKIKHIYDWDILQYDYDQKEGSAMSRIIFVIHLKYGRKIVLDINCSYLIIYKGIPDKHPEAVEMFMKRIGRFAAYPYFRTHVSQLSWESNTKLPILPTIRS